MAGQTSHKKVLCGHVQDWPGRWNRVNDGSLEENGKQIEPHICAMAAKAKEEKNMTKCEWHITYIRMRQINRFA